MDLNILVESTKYEHSKQVSKISEILARNLGYPPNEVSIITQAAAFHDIGKNAIPKEILNKPAALTPEEFEIVKTHTRIGYELLFDAARVLSVAATMAREHHEHIDGLNGYHHIAGAKIHPYARLIAISDVFDALLSRRSYKNPWSVPEIESYFRDQSGRQFDIELVKVLTASLDEILVLYANTH